MFHVWVYAAWIEKNSLKEARPEVAEDSTEVKIKIKGTRKNIGSPRNYQILGGGGEESPSVS